SAAAKRAIGKYVKVDDQKMLDASYDAYAPYLETSLAVRDQVIRAELDYLNEKEFPRAKSANPKEFFDNSFVDNLEKTNFFATIGLSTENKSDPVFEINSRLLIMYLRFQDVEAGGLMSYGMNLNDLDRRAATYIDKIFKGRTAADLPVEQINLKAAKQIGPTIPPEVLAR